jgi:hypothetical protein
LVFGLGLTEGSSSAGGGDQLAWLQARGVDGGDRLFCDLPLLVLAVEDG